MRKALFIIFCFYIFNCCKNKTGNEFEKADFIVIPIDENISEISNFDSFIEKVKYIPLETNEDSKIQAITQVEIIDEKIIIFDKKGKSVLIFNSKGKFLQRIGKMGTGLSEYLDIRNIATDEESNKIYLFDQLQFTILEYDLDGNFIKKISFNNIFFSYFKSSYGRFYCYMHNRPYKGNYYDLISFEQNEIKNMYFPFSKKDNNFWFLPQYPFYCFNNQLNYVDIFRGQTFILSERLIPKYLIDFGKKQMPFKIRNNKVLFFENRNKYAYLTNEFLENDNYLQFSYHWGKDIFNCIYLKKNDMTIRIKNSYNWHERVPALFIKPSYAKTNYFVSILSNIQCLKMKKNSEKLKDQQLKNVVSNFDLGDNPILIMYFLK